MGAAKSKMIITNNEDLLRIKCEDVAIDEVSELVSILEKELDHANRLGVGGIGLAAPQIGIAKNIAIVRLKEHNFNLINAKIEKGYDSSIFRSEGCLSFPGRVEDTTRFQEIFVINNLVYPYKFVATGLLAVVCQHEIDHLNGSLFIDHVIPNSKEIKLKLRPNDPCSCGSKDPKTGLVRKFKKCCGK